MPYVDKKTRDLLDAGMPATQPGELNYQITMLVSGYLANMEKVNYAAINEVIGALEAAKLELYARIARPYEDKKLYENGDVYPHSIKTEEEWL